MHVIGLTGNIGSGKSSVARLLRELGAQVIDADQVARDVVLPGKPALAALVEEFGSSILDENKALDRKVLGDIVFANPQARKKLNEIVHPYIKEVIEQTISDFRQKPPGASSSEVLVIEAPLLFEVGLDKKVDAVWVVIVDEAKQIERLVARDNLTPQEIKNRIASQLPQDLKRKRATRIIDNSGDFSATKEQVQKLWDELQNEKCPR